ncbi:hypothetical protein C8R46DRAFT_1192988 [Mycena filopes]|nr:hypothetical protein C8R46DRAFT_1192988 [Mycena filopes]
MWPALLVISLALLAGSSATSSTNSFAALCEGTIIDDTSDSNSNSIAAIRCANRTFVVDLDGCTGVNYADGSLLQSNNASGYSSQCSSSTLSSTMDGIELQATCYTGTSPGSVHYTASVNLASTLNSTPMRRNSVSADAQTSFTASHTGASRKPVTISTSTPTLLPCSGTVMTGTGSSASR